MYIKNPDKIENKIKVSKKIAKLLMQNEIPLLSCENGVFYFADTEEARELIKKNK